MWPQQTSESAGDYNQAMGLPEELSELGGVVAIETRMGDLQEVPLGSSLHSILVKRK